MPKIKVSGAVFITLFFFLAFEFALCAKLERPSKNKHSSLLGQFISYKEKSAVNMASGAVFTTLYFLLNFQIGSMNWSVILR